MGNLCCKEAPVTEEHQTNPKTQNTTDVDANNNQKPKENSTSIKQNAKNAKESSKSISEKVYKLLLLGSGESGKSTLFKRMQAAYGRGFQEEDRMEFYETICDNTIDSMRTLIAQSRNLEEDDCAYDPALDEEAELIETLDEGATLTKASAVAIQKLWADPGIKKTFQMRALFQVPDSAEYFFEDVNRIARKGYIPTEQDVLRCRDRTTGVTKERLLFHLGNRKINFDIFDVGGQRSERRAWVKIFQNVNAVIFVVAISEFDQLCFEDESTNRLDDAITVFRMVSNSRHFDHVPIVLLFNKIDLFKKKLDDGVNFLFEGYAGDQDYEAVTDYVQGLFEEQNDTDKAIISRFVCAIGPDFNLDQVLKTIVEENIPDRKSRSGRTG